MKLAYRIVTPILAVGAVAMGFFLKLFTFNMGSADEQINNLVSAVSQLFEKLNTTFEYSAFEIIKMAASGVGSKTTTVAGTETEVTLAEAAKAIIPNAATFAVVFAIILGILLAIAVVSALANSKKKRMSVIIMSAAGLVLSFVCIVSSNGAFEKIINGDVNITNIVNLVSGNAIAALATAIISVRSASLSAGFYGVFGLFIVIILWTVVSNMVIKTPILPSKAHKNKPKRSIKAILNK